MTDVIGVTGTPGTGKKSISPLMAEALGLRCLGVNDLARQCGALARRAGAVDVDLLRSKIPEVIRGRALLYGHLVPYVLDRRSVSSVVVLRCAPGALKKRLAARGYPAKKVEENVEAELIGVVSADAFSAFGNEKVFEFDTTRTTPSGAAGRIVRLLRKGRSPDRIDWTLGYRSGAKLRSLLSG